MKRIFAIALALVLALSLAAAPAMAASASALLKSIGHLAHEGEILNCDIAIKAQYSDVTSEYGKADRESFVKSANGEYATFSKEGVVVGFNKGEEIFELRCYSKRLHVITEKETVAEFGDPDHRSKSDGQLILTYNLSNDYQVKFVYDGESSSSKLAHYNVVWPEGEKSSMAG